MPYAYLPQVSVLKACLIIYYYNKILFKYSGQIISGQATNAGSLFSCFGIWLKLDALPDRYLRFTTLFYLVSSSPLLSRSYSISIFLCTLSLLSVSFYNTVSEICFHIGECLLRSFMGFSISIRKCCWGPKIEPGLAILIHPMKSAALKL